jgi:PiT family inorganic phosphate transporter
VPILIGLMSIAFATYLMLKGIKKIVKIDFPTALEIGTGIGIMIYFIVKPMIAKVANKLENTKVSVNTLFSIPLIFAAALLSFAHGANDVANAIGPLAAINDAIMTGGEFGGKVGIPIWVMGVGAVGIAIGLALYGPKLIKAVGTEITELDQMRAFSIAMAAAITVIIASQLGLPVSSTHIAVGGVFGVGFLREYLDNSETNFLRITKERFKTNKKELEILESELIKLDKIKDKSKKDYQKIIELIKLIEDKHEIVKDEKREFKTAKKIKYVKRDAVKKIIAAWVITVPAAATLSACVSFMIKGIMY